MKTRVFDLAIDAVPYIKEVQPLAKTVTGSILMVRLEQWFERHPDGFSKFLEPCAHPEYVAGQSWAEELRFSIAEFRTAFDHIGARYASKAEYQAQADPFQGRLYASYIDRNLRQTYYFRNHAVLDKTFAKMQREAASGRSLGSASGVRK